LPDISFLGSLGRAVRQCVLDLGPGLYGWGSAPGLGHTAFAGAFGAVLGEPLECGRIVGRAAVSHLLDLGALQDALDRDSDFLPVMACGTAP